MKYGTVIEVLETEREYAKDKYGDPEVVNEFDAAIALLKYEGAR